MCRQVQVEREPRSTSNHTAVPVPRVSTPQRDESVSTRRSPQPPSSARSPGRAGSNPGPMSRTVTLMDRSSTVISTAIGSSVAWPAWRTALATSSFVRSRTSFRSFGGTSSATASLTKRRASLGASGTDRRARERMGKRSPRRYGRCRSSRAGLSVHTREPDGANLEARDLLEGCPRRNSRGRRASHRRGCGGGNRGWMIEGTTKDGQGGSRSPSGPVAPAFGREGTRALFEPMR